MKDAAPKVKKEIIKEPLQASKENAEAPIVKELEPMPETKITINLPLIIVALSIVIAGGFTGFILSRGNTGLGSPIVGSKTTKEGLKKIVDIKDESTFKDDAQGKLIEGGIDGEGSHHLEREGGASQNVYLTSSVVPLDDYVGMEVKVWGETFAAEKAGWFMDVGRLELLE